MRRRFPQSLQEDLLDVLESEKRNELVSATKIKQARLIVSLKQKRNPKKPVV